MRARTRRRDSHVANLPASRSTAQKIISVRLQSCVLHSRLRLIELTVWIAAAYNLRNQRPPAAPNTYF